MEILVENDGYTHHHDKHIHKVGTFVHTGEECAQIGSVAKEEVGKGTQEQTASHHHTTFQSVHHITIDKA